MELLQSLFVSAADGAPLPIHYDVPLVAASLLIATMGGYAFLRLTTRIVELGRSAIRLEWIAAAGLTMGLGVWAMHFLGMLAYRLPVPIGYDPVIIGVSAVPVVLGATATQFVIARPRVDWKLLLLGGLMLGASIGVTHYTGMFAMRFDGVVRYDPWLLLVAVVGAVALSSAALAITHGAVRRGAPASLSRDVLGALMVGVAVTTIHYVAMEPVLCFAVPELQRGLAGIQPEMFVLSAVVAGFVMVMTLMSVMFDRRLSSEIAGRTRASDRLLDRENHLGVIMDNVADALVTIDSRGTVSSFNRAAERIFGYAAAEVIGQNVTVLMAPHLRDPHRNGMERYLSTGVPRVVGKGPIEVEGRHRDGRPIPIELTVSEAREGKRSFFIGAMRDVSERKAIEAQLLQAQKMEAVGQLTGGIAHDFNNLLGIIIGNLDLLKEDRRGEDEALVRDALDSALRGAELNRRLLAFSRRQELQPAVLDARMVMDGMHDLLARALGERTQLQITADHALWPIKVDRAQLETAILNLAVNARDAMPDGGTFIVQTANVTVDAQYAAGHPGVHVGDYVSISVSDSGSGMTKEVLGRAFEPFFTTKPVGEGSGLGLSMVFGFLKQSGGYVNLFSEPGHGTTVRLYLPRSESAVLAPVRRADHDPERSPGGNETILLVEDNASMAQVATQELIGLGYTVLTAANAAEALEHIEGSTHIDLLFSDIVMPGTMDGTGLARLAVGLRPGIKVLLTSGFAQRPPDTALPARLLAKPYRRHTLAVAVRQTLDE